MTTREVAVAAADGSTSRRLGKTSLHSAATPRSVKPLENALKETLANSPSARSRGSAERYSPSTSRYLDFLATRYAGGSRDARRIAQGMARNWDFQPGDGGEPDELARVLDWGVLLQQSRCDIVKRLFTTFSPTNGFASVGLYTPSLVDFEHWLNEKAPVSIPKQIELMERLSIAFKGRIHGFAPYDPWRQVDDEFNKRDETALNSVKRAVLEHGLIGVKLYPPMGFRAITNTELSVKDFPSHLGSKPYQSGFGAALDAALERLYAFCVENQVPVMAHAAPTQEASSGLE